jgi:Rab GDP dissociation inhibitor
MYVSMVSSAHAVCAKGLFIAIVSTTVETKDPEKEIQPAIDLLGGCLEVFIQISDLHEPTNDPLGDNLWVTSSYDATSHFETASIDVLNIYERMTGEKLDMNIQPSADDDY